MKDIFRQDELRRRVFPIEIASGRGRVLDLPPDKAKEVFGLVSATDGLIVHFY